MNCSLVPPAPGKRRQAHRLLAPVAALMLAVVGCGQSIPAASAPSAPAVQQPASASASTQASISASASASPQSAASNWQSRAVGATMQIFVSTADSQGKFKQLGGCSGTLVDPSGLVLTNWHCIGQTDVYGADETGLGLEHGDMLHPRGLVVLGPTLDPQERPVPTYIGLVVQGSPDIDIAVVKIFQMWDSQQRIPKPLPITPIVLGDSSKVKVGDRVHTFGYPGSGGPMLTSTTGQISGFYKIFQARPDLEVDAFKTDAVIEPGNSGGLATNDEGEQIGITTFSRKNSRLSGIVLVNLAKSYIQKALSDAEPLQPRPHGTKPAATATPKPIPSPSPTPTTQTSPGVTLKGQIVDFDTKRGVPGALFAILKPGVTPKQWVDSKFADSMVASFAEGSPDGAYRTSPPLAREHAYSAVIVAKGYRPFESTDGLKLAKAAPAELAMDPIPLHKL